MWKALSKLQRILARVVAFAEWPAIVGERQLVPRAITLLSTTHSLIMKSYEA